jgi:hypothetical protein
MMKRKITQVKAKCLGEYVDLREFTEQRQLHNEEIHDFFFFYDIIRTIQ